MGQRGHRGGLLDGEMEWRQAGCDGTLQAGGHVRHHEAFHGHQHVEYVPNPFRRVGARHPRKVREGECGARGASRNLRAGGSGHRRPGEAKSSGREEPCPAEPTAEAPLIGYQVDVCLGHV